jgi:hypothetical protein
MGNWQASEVSEQLIQQETKIKHITLFTEAMIDHKPENDKYSNLQLITKQ